MMVVRTEQWMPVSRKRAKEKGTVIEGERNVDAIASSAIGINGIAGVSYVYQMNIDNVPSTHPTAYIECGLKQKTQLERLDFEADVVQITAYGKVLFTGLIQQVQLLEPQPKVYQLKLWLVARSKLLDMIPKYRSFQNVSVRYADVIRIVAEATKGVYVNNRLLHDRAIKTPVIQYRETDWEYIKRLASKCNEPIIVDEQGMATEILLGKFSHEIKAEFIEGYHKQGYRDTYYTKHLSDYDISRAYTKYHKVRSYDTYPVGYQVSYQGQLYYICEKHAFIEQELLIWEYVIAHEQYLFEPTTYNEYLTGTTILGNTVAAEQEKVKLELRLKDEENEGVYHAYQWVPETGNMMYCMPQEGSIVSLYFPDGDEASAMVVNSLRLGEDNTEIYDPSVKSFITEEGDAWAMTDSAIHMLTQKDDVVTNQLTLLDEEGLLLRSVKRISIHSDTGIAIEGASILIEAKTNIGFDQGRCTEEDVSFNFFGFYAGVFHMVGQDKLRIVLAGYYKDKGFGLIMDVPEAGQRKKFTLGMALNLGIGILTVGAIAALCVFALPVALGFVGVAAGTASAIGAGAAAGAVVTGLFAVGEKTVEDYNRGEATDPFAFWRNIAVKTLGGAVEGGICALAGPVTWAGSKMKIAGKITTKLLCDQAGNAVATISDNLIDGDAWNQDLGITSLTTLVTGGVFDILPASPLGDMLFTKAGKVSDKIGKRFASTDAGLKVSKFFGNVTSTIKGKWENSKLYQKYLSGLRDKNYISYINNTRDSLEKLDDNLIDAVDAKKLFEAEKQQVDDTIKMIKQQIGQGGDVDALKQQLMQLKKQSQKLGIDIANKANTVNKLGAKLKKSNKLIQKVMKQESTDYISLAVSKKLWRVLYIDTLNALGGKLKSEATKKIVEETGKKIEEAIE